MSNRIIPLSIPVICGKEWKYIKDCLDTGWVSSAGKYVNKLEEEICKYTGAKHAVACVNGTAALHISLMLVGVQPDDEVIVPTLTFIAPVNVVRYLNASPIFMDADKYYNLDVQKTIQFIKEETKFKNGFSYNKKTGKRISAIIPVHVFGHAVDIELLMPICHERNIKIIEDATESLGTYYNSGCLKNNYAGTICDIGCFSFNANKIITTGGGGMIVTNKEEYAKRARYLTTQAKDDPVQYIHNEIGFNYRLTNLQAAMGVAQLEQLEKYIEIKKKNYFIYKKEVDDIPGLQISVTPDYAESNYWFYCLQIDNNTYGKNKDQLMSYLGENKIQARPIWHLNHLQKPYRNYQNHKIERALELQKITLNIPCSVNLSESDAYRVIECIKNG